MDRIANEILRDVSLDEIEPKQKKPANPVDHWTPPVLLERAAYLRKLAKAGDGQAGETLRDYPQHRAMLSFRSRSGEVEIHEKFADLFIVLAGEAALATGGTGVGARQVAAGETRGDSIEGGVKQPLRAGEIVHVPAGIPHQFLLSGEKTITCLVMKIQESA